MKVLGYDSNITIIMGTPGESRITNSSCPPMYMIPAEV